MKRRHFMVLALGVLFSSACSRAIAGEPGPTIMTPSIFSYQAPSGWTSQVAGGLELGGFPQAVAPASNNFTPDITFVTAGYHTVAAFVKTYQPHLLDMTPRQFPLKLVAQEPFVTAAGVKGVRLQLIDPATPPIAVQFSYFFNNQDGMIYEFACACAPADAAHYAPIFDASMKTVKLLKVGG